MIRFSTFAGAFAIAIALISAPTASFAGVFFDIGISVNTAPPPLPVYFQPPCPQPDLIWTPGYWAYSSYDGYYWVPGAWVEAPQVGYLWTPGYWGYGGNAYAWHPGYWGSDVGFYGGVDYGHGYFGHGFYGGRWSGDHFRYNTAYVNVNRTVINNVYINRTVINNYNSGNRVSYNGGPRGTIARASAREIAYRDGFHVPATAFQRTSIENAARNRGYFASVNHGRPPEAAIDRSSYAAGAARARNIGGDPYARFDHPRQTRPTYRSPEYRAPGAGNSARNHESTTYVSPSYHAPASYKAHAYDSAPKYQAPVYRDQTYHASAYHAPAYRGRADTAVNHAQANRVQGYHPRSNRQPVQRGPQMTQMNHAAARESRENDRHER